MLVFVFVSGATGVVVSSDFQDATAADYKESEEPEKESNLYGLTNAFH